MKKNSSACLSRLVRTGTLLRTICSVSQLNRFVSTTLNVSTGCDNDRYINLIGVLPFLLRFCRNLRWLNIEACTIGPSLPEAGLPEKVSLSNVDVVLYGFHHIVTTVYAVHVDRVTILCAPNVHFGAKLRRLCENIYPDLTSSETNALRTALPFIHAESYNEIATSVLTA